MIDKIAFQKEVFELWGKIQDVYEKNRRNHHDLEELFSKIYQLLDKMIDD